jgi:hypothetical protein
MPERDELDPQSAAPLSGAPATPRVSGEIATGTEASETPMPASNTRAAFQSAEQGVPSEPSDTLLSAGKPADRLELMLDDRLGIVDDRINDLYARLAVLEQKKPLTTNEPRQKPWLWIAFLIALVVVFQLLHALK